MYNFQESEKKWSSQWVEDKIFTIDLAKAKNPFYALFMFPYPSAEGLHMGNFYAFTCVDMMAKFKKLQGYDVFEPIGWDAFGIHSENYALKIGETPQKMLERTIANFRVQLKSAGLGCDWTREVDTTKPEYYKWTQWIFTKMFEKGLAYQKEALLNWCPSCKTVLADEQIENEKCERCGTTPEKKEMKQWFLKITHYAQRLLDGLDEMNWSDVTKAAQRNWINRSEGAEVDFEINGQKVTVFTTRPDTLFGATYFVLAPEHSLVSEITTKDQKAEVEKYIKESGAKSDLERTENKEKTGVFTGAYAVNPVNNEKIPVWIADYVLMGYGTGAIMAVPAHDERDFEFAKKYDLDIIQVVAKEDITPRSYLMGAKNITDQELIDIHVKIIETTKKGSRLLEIPISNLEDYKKLIKEKLDNGFWNEIVSGQIDFIFKDKDGNIQEFVLTSDNADQIDQLANEYNNENRDEIVKPWKWIAENEFYHDLIIHNEDGRAINSEFLNGLKTEEAKNKIITWLEQKKLGKGTVNYKLRDWCISRQRYWGPPVPIVYCENCGPQAVPEKDLPVLLPELEEGWEPAGDGRGPLAKVDKFMNAVCLKCGGPAQREADVMDNFLDSAWYFFRYVSPKNDEYLFDPKIGKKWLPVDIYIGGNEHAVLHLMYTRFITMVLHDLGVIDFDNPFKKFIANGMILKDGKKMSKSKGNVINPEEYGEKVGYDALKTYLLFLGPLDENRTFTNEGLQGTVRWVEKIAKLSEKVIADYNDSDQVLKKLHQTIKAVTADFEDAKYNTAIAKLMELSNELSAQKKISQAVWQKFLIIITPFTPCLAEEMWSRQGNSESIFKSSWPEYDQKFIEENEIELPVQINGKVRAKVLVSPTIEEKDLKPKVLADDNVIKWLEGKEVKKIVYVKGKIVNLVI